MGQIVPLPDFSNFDSVWIEKTKSSHGHGGAGWEFGTCLWSPTVGKTGHNIYKNMERAKKGDLVLHFYEDTPFGKVEDHYFCGLSAVSSPAEVITTEPPRPGDWAGRGSYFRIGLDGFMPFSDPLPITDFIAKNGSALLTDQPGEEPSFVLYQDTVRLAQGKYLAQCPAHLYSLLSAAIDEVAQPPILLSSEKQSADSKTGKKAFDYEEYVEGQRARREANFFVRNPQLVRDAKAHYGPTCRACEFTYETRYPELGKGYIEIHHLNPLSERNGADASAKLSKLDQVTALCANCHRMIHRLIRKTGRAVTIEEFREYLAT